MAMLTCCVPAMAQMNLFVGWSVQAATGYQSISPKLSNYSSPYASAYTNSESSTGYPLVVNGNYTWSVSERVVMGLGYERNLRRSNPSSQYFSGTGVTTTMGFKNQSQLSVMAGQLIRNDGMVYTKLGYATMDTTNAINNFSLSGYGLGLGYKTFLNPFQFVFTEVNYTKMGDTNVTSGTQTFKASATGKGALIGMGWQF